MPRHVVLHLDEYDSAAMHGPPDPHGTPVASHLSPLAPPLCAKVIARPLSRSTSISSRSSLLSLLFLSWLQRYATLPS